MLVNYSTIEKNSREQKVAPVNEDEPRMADKSFQTLFTEFDISKVSGPLKNISYCPHYYLSKDSSGKYIICSEASTQIDHDKDNTVKHFVNSSTNTDRFFGFDSVNRSGNLKALTSVEENIFQAILLMIEDYNPISLKREDLLVMVLMKLKFSLPFSALSPIFGITSEALRVSFYKIIDLMSQL